MGRVAGGAIPARVRERLADATFEAIAIVEGTAITWCNRAFEEMFGIDREDVIGMSPLELAAPEDRPRILAAIQSGSPEPYEATGVRRDGTRFVGELRGRQVEVDGRVYRLTAIRDITERRAMEESLRQSEARYRDLFDKAGDGLLVMDHRAMPRQVNDRLCELLGRSREEILAMTPDQALVNIERKPMQLDRLEQIPAYIVERQLRHADGTAIDVEVNVTATSDGEILAIIRDLRERKRAAAQEAALRDRLQQAQSLEALGRLAGGVAHDFNNLLTVIMSASEILSRRGVDAPQLDEIRVAAERATELTGKLLTFSRTAPEHVTRLDVGAQLETLRPLLRRLVGPEHELRVEVAGPLHLLADASQLTQVVMNLVLNARDAMRGAGAIRVTLFRREVLNWRCASCGELFNGSFAVIEVRDDGPGIAETNVRRVFDPFFTTKEVGEGTGLGLSVVHGIIHGARGHVVVDSRRGAGTVMRLLLPDAAPFAEESGDESSRPSEEDVSAVRVLVAEDELSVATFISEALQSQGYAVKLCQDGSEARAALEAEPGAFDLLVTDLTMPVMSGSALAEYVNHRKLGLPVILMSGYSEDVSRGSGALPGVHAFISKPVGLQKLLDTVRHVLQSQRGTLSSRRDTGA